MEKIIFYKLVSPYPEDETKNCKLTMEDLDQNMLALKDHDISGATYNSDTMVIDVVLNNGDEINIDISAIADQIDTKIEEAISGTSGGCECNIDLQGELQNDGTLILSWKAGDDEYQTSVRGFLTENNQVVHDSTLSGNATADKPIGIAETEKAGDFRIAEAIVDELPGYAHVGDRYVKRTSVSSFGRVYNKEGLDILKTKLIEMGGIWRIPTKEDWDKLLNFAEECDDNTHSGREIAEYTGDIAGKVLKSKDYWSDENLDTFKFTSYPSGYAKPDGELVGENSMYWTDTLTEYGKNFVKGFLDESDKAWQDEAEEGYYYSIRLVRDIEADTLIDDNILGHNYGILNFGSIGQAWTQSSLIFDTGDDTSRQYEYDVEGPGIVSDVFVLSVWNGSEWEQKELRNGDKIRVGENGSFIEYVCIVGNDGNQSLVPFATFKDESGKIHIRIDSGWY